MERGFRAAVALGALAFVLAGGAAFGGSWDERVFEPGSHVDFDAVAAAGPSALPALIERGRELFKAKFTTVDGAGRPKATQAIVPTKRKNGVNPPFHNEPVIGGSADDVGNVFVSEGFESAQFDSIDPSFSSERHTIALMGSGLVELLAREMTADPAGDPCFRRRGSLRQRQGRPRRPGVEGRSIRLGRRSFPTAWSTSMRSTASTADLIVRPFSRKGVFTSVRQFTINALNIHHGMEAVERFGVRWTGSHDFAESGVPDSITVGDVSALVAFQATLAAARPSRPDLPDDWRAAAGQGAETFKAIGCDSCHMESLPLKSLVFTDPAPYDMAGTLRSSEAKTPIRIDLGALPFAKTLKRNDKGEWLIPLYSDLKRHLVVDSTINALGNELQAQRFVERDVFLTTRLWGVGSTSPYGHNGSFRMLDEIIVAHGGDARFARDAYVALDPEKRDGIVAFLRSLIIEAPQ